ncbi:D-2-hydroxyacid dehydrogenase [Halomonas beimenensis]|uniref:D-3-phosphoglycerate dehydrogenase n=1 Tax=Halomonas beimenensis TaxID=475662 RepID=A0A291P7K1_9GAMM|nr:D-2-hydroxyacid dehydrogenase [Halomonas beimenensis]ATJ82857.1 D-3-phosphoglycerate dehydrogenase [Halomonas beimenensis]
MHAVILDADSLGHDIDLAPIEARVSRLDVHARTPPDRVVGRLAGAQVAIVNKVVLDASALAALPELRLICVLATGTNNIDMVEAERRGIEVRNVTAYGTASVAQHTLMLLLALAGRLPRYQRDVADGRWGESPFFCLMDHRTLQLDGKRLVIVGRGELGAGVGRLAEAFGMTVDYAARPGAEEDPRPTLARAAGDADAISLHCPLTPATRHLVDDALLSRVKPGALLVNCARGGIIDELAALAALRSGRLGGLAVDVLPEEPPRDGHPLIDALQEPLNLIVTPHNAWISPEARQRIVELTAENLEGPLRA